MHSLLFRVLKAQFVILLTSMMFITTGCEDTDDDHDHDHDAGHTDAEGFVLKTADGTELYKQLEGNVVTNNLSVAVGQELELAVHFLDHDGEEIEHDDHDDEHTTEESTLRVTVLDATIATVEVEGHGEDGDDDHGDDDHDHGDEHGHALHVSGVSAGSTSFKLELMHGDHADYTSSPDVTITVTSTR
tara:strand:- start:254 stop:817 length:564 start_codon:yes stop_codon:yes gene_type:complete